MERADLNGIELVRAAWPWRPGAAHPWGVHPRCDAAARTPGRPRVLRADLLPPPRLRRQLTAARPHDDRRPRRRRRRAARPARHRPRPRCRPLLGRGDRPRDGSQRAGALSSLALLEPPYLAGAAGDAFMEVMAPIVGGTTAATRPVRLPTSSGSSVMRTGATRSATIPGGVAQAEKNAATSLEIELAAVAGWTFGPARAGAVTCPVLSILGTATAPSSSRAAGSCTSGSRTASTPTSLAPPISSRWKHQRPWPPRSRSSSDRRRERRALETRLRGREAELGAREVELGALAELPLLGDPRLGLLVGDPVASDHERAHEREQGPRRRSRGRARTWRTDVPACEPPRNPPSATGARVCAAVRGG